LTVYFGFGVLAGRCAISGVEAAVFWGDAVCGDGDGGRRGDLGVLFSELLIEIILEFLAFDGPERGGHDGG
jgi:hypothetical protein